MPAQIADDQFSLDAESTPYAQALADCLRESGDWVEVVPGIDSVVVRFDALGMPSDEARHRLQSICESFEFAPAGAGPLIEIPVVYGGDAGPDLAGICATLGISEDEFIQRHTSVTFPVELVGFTPGFAFVGGLPEVLQVPRRTEPRQAVAAGSVAVADSRTGLYAMGSPGGWNIIGRTNLPLFNPDADQPFLLSPGMRVMFVAE